MSDDRPDDVDILARALGFVAEFQGDPRCALNCLHAEALAAEIHRLRDARDLLYAAVCHTLDQIQVNPDVHYYCGWGTQIFYLLIRAEAAHLGKPLDEVEAARRKDLQPAYRRREAEVLRLRDQRDELRAQLDGGL